VSGKVLFRCLDGREVEERLDGLPLQCSCLRTKVLMFAL
jgi:hypothetical protein